MSNTNFTFDEDDISLEPEDRARIQKGPEWLKMTKTQTLLGAFLYFHPVDVVAVRALRKANKSASPEEVKSTAAKALAAVAEKLQKSPDQLEPDEKLDLGAAEFKSFKAHYQEGVGFVLSRLGRDGAEADSVWKKLPEPKQYFTTLLLVYPTTPEGKHNIEAIKAGQWRIVPWRFSPATYGEIWNLNDGLRANGMSVASQDIKLDCKDTKFQTMKVSFVGKAMWQQSPVFKKTILQKALSYYDKLVPFREMSTDHLRAKLGISGISGGALAAVANEDCAGLLDQV